MDKKVPAKPAKPKNPTDEKKTAAKLSQQRWKLAMVLNFLVAAFGVLLTFITYSSVSTAKKYLEFVEGFDGGDLLMILAVVGIISALVGLYGASVTSLSVSVKKRQRIKHLAFAYIGWGGGLVVLAGASCGLIYATVGNLDVVFKPGFTDSMIKYEKETAVKDSIDAVQAQLKCCGNFNHTEWYTVSWTEAVSKADVKIPPSCCDKNATAAQHNNCVTNVPFGESLRLTPYAAGCVPALVAFYGQLLTKATYVLVLITLITGGTVSMVLVETRGPGETGKPKKENPNLLKKQGPIKAGTKKKETKKSEDSDDSDDSDDSEDKPRKPAKPAPLPRGPMGYPAMSYPYGYGAAPAMPMPMPR